MEAPPDDVLLIPYTELSSEALRAVAESFVLREGTDYGERELPLEEKVRRLLAQLENGDASIAFDAKSESVTILPVTASTGQ